MGYRAILKSSPETVQDLERAADLRLAESKSLQVAGKHHTAIYIAGLSAEMYLKTACFFLGGAKPADQVEPLRQAMEKQRRKVLYGREYDSGDGL